MRPEVWQGLARALHFTLGTVGSKEGFCKGLAYMRSHVEFSQPEIEPTSPKDPGQGSLPSGHAGLCFTGTAAKLKGVLVSH